MYFTNMDLLDNVFKSSENMSYVEMDLYAFGTDLTVQHDDDVSLYEPGSIGQGYLVFSDLITGEDYYGRRNDVEFQNEIELYNCLSELKNFSVSDFVSDSLEQFMDTDTLSPLDVYESLSDKSVEAFVEATNFDLDNFYNWYPEFKEINAHPVEMALFQAEETKSEFNELFKTIDEEINFKNRFEKEVILNSANGVDLYNIMDMVPITKELEDTTHFLSWTNMEGDPNPYISYVIETYKDNPLMFFDNVRDEGLCPNHEIDLYEWPDAITDDEEYRSDIYQRLSDCFKEQYHFVPKVLPQLECGLAYLYGTEISDATLKDFVSNFNRSAVAMVKDTYNPTLITMAAMGKVLPGNITKDQKEILSVYLNTLDIKDYYKISEVLMQSSKGASLEDYKNVVTHPDIAAEYLKSVNGMHDVTFKEISQEINNKWMERERDKFERDYNYSFSDNKVEIEGSHKVIEMNGLKAYILPADDLRNFTVGYDTDCCQHYGGAGESCVVAATTRPNAGIFVIEKNEKIEAQGFVWTTGHPDENGNYVFDSLAFDNIEFANGQNLNKHGLTMKAYDEGITKDEYRACKKTMDYEGILAAYVKELPYNNVYMGTGYNTMDSIGSKINEDTIHYDNNYFLSVNIKNMVQNSIGNTYTDFHEDARVLKFDGEMMMESQKDMVQEGTMMVSTGRETEYEVYSMDEEIEEPSLDNVLTEMEGKRDSQELKSFPTQERDIDER